MKASPLRRAVDMTLRQCPFSLEGAVFVCGLSGGADSVALLDALVDLARVRGFRVVAGHLDHGLRPDSGEDAAFCAQLCARLGVPFETARADVRGRARLRREGIEAAAREERYAFLRAVSARRMANAIAVGHTRDDQAETVLLRLLRGAGAAGLAAMRPFSQDIVRPLLAASRADVLDYLAERRLTWREDPSNTDRALLRNRIRHDLLPYLEGQFNPRLRERLAAMAMLLTDENDVLDAMAVDLLARAGRGEPGQVILSRMALTQAPPALARRALRMACGRAGAGLGLSAVLVERILALARTAAPSGRRITLPGGREAVFEFDMLRIAARQHATGWAALPLSVPGCVEIPGGWTVSVAPCSSEAPQTLEQAHVSAEDAERLMVRTRRPGDRVRVNGREISLKRFLCQRRVPVGERPALPLVAAGDRIVWIPGQRLDDGTCGPRRIHVGVSRNAAAEAALVASQRIPTAQACL
jgi:tRNA(Ile)-lysidine synthase